MSSSGGGLMIVERQTAPSAAAFSQRLIDALAHRGYRVARQVVRPSILAGFPWPSAEIA
jgi:hypothetical protein